MCGVVVWVARSPLNPYSGKNTSVVEAVMCCGQLGLGRGDSSSRTGKGAAVRFCCTTPEATPYAGCVCVCYDDGAVGEDHTTGYSGG